MDKNMELVPGEHVRPIYTCKNITVADKCVIFDLKVEPGASYSSDHDMTLAIKKSAIKEMLKTISADESVSAEAENDFGEK